MLWILASLESVFEYILKKVCNLMCWDKNLKTLPRCHRVSLATQKPSITACDCFLVQPVVDYYAFLKRDYDAYNTTLIIPLCKVPCVLKKY